MAAFLGGLAMKGLGAAKSFGKSELDKFKTGIKQKYGDSSSSSGDPNSPAKKKKKLADALQQDTSPPAAPIKPFKASD